MGVNLLLMNKTVSSIAVKINGKTIHGGNSGIEGEGFRVVVGLGDTFGEGFGNMMEVVVGDISG